MKKLVAKDPETQSADVLAENIEQLKALFPEAFTEGKIDFEVLKHLLGGAVDEREEKFGLNWHGKRQARQLALTPSTGTLRPCPEDSVDWDTTQNLMIEGDNLEVLKLLQKSYAGKVKLIYIDPPYNTGKDFVYPDDFRDNIKNYLELTGQLEGGHKITSNTEASGRFHTDWLNMMYPRLKSSRGLLRDDGVILVSMNDIESPRLRLVLDEIFGEENFLCQFVWNNEGNVDQQSKIKGVHEYVVAYARRLDGVQAPTVIDPNIEETSKLYNDQIENSITKNGPANPPSEVILPVGFPAAFQEGKIKKRSDQWPHILDDICVSEGKLAKSARVRSGWSSRNLLELFINNGCVPIEDSSGKTTWFSVTSTGAIYGYKKRSENQGHVLSVIRNVGTTKQNSSMLSDWDINFAYPKPKVLLQYLAQVFTAKGGADLVVDFFAGSGTMGHAIYSLNASDNGSRRFVLVQLPEPIDPSENGGLRSLADLTAKRLRCASAQTKNDNPGFQGDLGFRVYRLNTSNIRTWEPDAANLEQTLLDHMEHIKEGRSEADILYELLLKLGLDLCVPIETKTIHPQMAQMAADMKDGEVHLRKSAKSADTDRGFTVHSIGAGTLFVCLDPKIARAEAEPLALGIAEWHKELNPAGDSTVVFRDSAFADDVAKTNVAAILEQHGLANVRSL